MKLNLAKFIVLACIGGCQFLPMQVSQDPKSVSTPTQTVTASAENGNSDLIRDKAQLISLRVYSIDPVEWKNNGLILNGSGSGVLIESEQTRTQPPMYKYLVLTANHVAPKSREKGKEAEFYIRTHDGLIHKARRHPQEFDKTDLALLYFYSPYQYEVAVTSKKSSLKQGDKVYVSGFPCDLGSRDTPCPAEFKLLEGEVSVKLTNPLVDNYSIGYTNEVIEGTSGGPILNDQGEIVGINGMREGGPPSQYKRIDGSESTADEINWMRTLRWGIPIDFYLKLDTNKLLKEIPPLNQEFAPTGYLIKPQPTPSQAQPTPSATPDKSPVAKSPNESPKNDNAVFKKVLNRAIIIFPYMVMVLGIGILIRLIFPKRRNNLNPAKLPPSNTYETEKHQPIAEISIKSYYKYNSPHSDPLFEGHILLLDTQDKKSIYLYQETGSTTNDKWTVIEEKNKTIFIKRTIISPVKGEPEPQVTSSKDYRFIKTSHNVWQLKQISLSAPSAIVIEFI